MGTMRSPIRPIPESVQRWVARGRLLRWLDALAAWLVLWLALAEWAAHLAWDSAALAALLVLGILVPLAPLRRHWRVVSGAVGLWMSRSIRAGDVAWLVGHGSAERVIVTARRGARLTVATLVGDATEGMRVRRTRVLLISS